MKRTLISVAVLLAGLKGFGQKKDSVYQKRKIELTDVQVLYATYLQEGVHSAVTGGIGTENLQVYSTDIQLQNRSDSSWEYSTDLGLDVISSASTDNIDFVVSSASKVDYRGHVLLSAGHNWIPSGISAGASLGLSMESDYYSRQVGLSFSKTNQSKTRKLFLDIRVFFDDLRWGRLTQGTYRPEKLIYPAELRGREWLDNYKRNSYHANLGFRQDVNRRTLVQIQAECILQEGLLSTPFHRVYFADTAKLRVEKLPGSRVRVPFGLHFRRFMGNNTIFKLDYNGYWDSFGIVGHGIQSEMVFKINPTLGIAVFGRWYGQTATRYFKPFAEHIGSQEFYTSDYDLSKIQTLKTGFGLRYSPYNKISRRWNWKALNFRYAYYSRNDGLSAHILTLLVEFQKE